MNIKHTISTIVLASVVTGCSHKPIPVDVIRKATRGIVHSVRCETRLAVEQALIKKWTEIGERYNHSATLALVDRVNRNELNYWHQGIQLVLYI